jgi:hypoxanthine phosphoribosyltransferase
VIILSWLINKQECLISYLEKKLLSQKYQYGSDPTYHPSLTFYSKDNVFQTVVLSIASILMILNLSVMMKIYKVNTFVIIIFLIIAISYTLYFRIIQILSQQQKQFLATSKVPEWILNDPHLSSVYFLKVYKPISYQNIFCVLTCYFDSLCIRKQLTWKDFEAHVEELSRNLPEFDYIVGIKSGGAFVAKYLSVITKKPVVYIKISKYDDGKFWQKDPSVSIHSDLSVLRNKNVLIVDDHILTGDTLAKSKEIVEMHQPDKVYTGVLYQNRDHPVINYQGIKASMSRSPWGSAV